MVQVQAEFYALVQLILGLIRDIQVSVSLNAQDLLVVVNLALQNTVSEGLGHHELHILWSDVQLGSHIGQGNLRIGQINLS